MKTRFSSIFGPPRPPPAPCARLLRSDPGPRTSLPDRRPRLIRSLGLAGPLAAALVLSLSAVPRLSAQAPTGAGFLVSPASPAAAELVVFTDMSAGDPTSWRWNFGDGATSTEQFPVHTFTAAGQFTVTLTVGYASGSSTATQTVAVRPAGTAPTPAYSLSQGISDRAQTTTLAFDGLAMMTGNLNAQSFFPPGKVSDYFGFQYLRDNDPDNMGHNTSFLTRVANNVISILNDSQFAQLKALASAQVDQIDLYAYERYPLMQAFRRLLDGDIPSGSTGLNLAAVKLASRQLYLVDGQISFDRALAYARIITSFDATQRAHLDAMKGRGWNSWPDVPKDRIAGRMANLPRGTGVAVMTYASDIFSWYAGSVDADVYFCPERHGTYYGGFYIKDAPAVGHEGYSINEQLTATAGAALCDASKGYVTASQAARVSALADSQRPNLYASSAANIVLVRTEISTLLRSLLATTAYSDVIESRVLALSAVYGDLDGENNHQYATVFAEVYRTMSTAQKTNLTALRKSLLSGTYADGTAFDFTVCTTPFLYSEVISAAGTLTPYIGNTDYLFFAPASGGGSTFTTPLTVTTLAGQALAAGNVDGAGSSARFFYPTGIVAAQGNLHVADTNNSTLRRIAVSSGAVTTPAGSPGFAGSADGAGSAASFNNPSGVAVDSAGNVYVADTLNHTLRKVTASGVVTTLAGLPGTSGSADGSGSNARFHGPQGLALDAAGNLLVADTNNHTIRKFAPSTGAVTTLGGLAGKAGATDGAGTSARFNSPTGVALDDSGSIYVADAENHTIRKITSAGVVSTLAGTVGQPGCADGTGTAAKFSSPSAIAFDHSSGNLCVADTGNFTIRMIVPATGVTSTLAGTAGTSGSTDGTGSAALFFQPTGIATDGTGAIYVADTDNHTIRVGYLPAAPSIQTQPRSQTVTAGSTAQFSVIGSGHPTPTCQWYFNGTAINGATGATFTVAAAQSTDAGTYTVKLVNSAGSVTSDPATLTVSAAATSSARSAVGGGASGGGAMGGAFSLAVLLVGAARAAFQRHGAAGKKPVRSAAATSGNQARPRWPHSS